MLTIMLCKIQAIFLCDFFRTYFNNLDSFTARNKNSNVGECQHVEGQVDMCENGMNLVSKQMLYGPNYL